MLEVTKIRYCCPVLLGYGIIIDTGFRLFALVTFLHPCLGDSHHRSGTGFQCRCGKDDRQTFGFYTTHRSHVYRARPRRKSRHRFKVVRFAQSQPAEEHALGIALVFGKIFMGVLKIFARRGVSSGVPIPYSIIDRNIGRLRFVDRCSSIRSNPFR